MHLMANNELHTQLPKEENFIDETNSPKKNTTPHEQKAYRFAKHSYWTDSAQKHIPKTTKIIKIIEKAYDGTLHDSK